MDLDLAAADDPRRVEVRAWLAEHSEPTRVEVAAAGYVAPHWPAPWGLGADPELQLIIDQELTAAGVVLPDASIAIGWAGPTLIEGGTVEQQRRWIPGILDGSAEWCQLFSEPDAGSDLASLRTRAVRDGDHYVVTGQKIWSTWANRSDWGILLARTDLDGPKHHGISYFCLDMTSPGIEVREIVEMTGGNHFNETWLDEVRIPVDCRVGEEGEGWRLARVTLGAERLSLAEGGVLWGMGPTAEQCWSHLVEQGPWPDALVRQRMATAWTHKEILRLLGLRMLTSAVAGEDASAFASIRKCLADEFGQEITGLIKDLRGAHAMLGTQSRTSEHDDIHHWGYLFSRALTIGGGTSEVQRNIIGERLLGLPRR